MNKFRATAKKFIIKCGALIASCAFVFAAISANTSCALPYYELEEPKGLDGFKKFNK